MIFSQHELPANLSGDIEAIFHFKGFMPDHSIERVVPTGHLFLLFELDGMTRHTYDNKTLAPQATYQEVWLSGMHKHHISISAHENSEMFVVQFKAHGAYPFLHRPVEEFNETVVSAETIFGDTIKQLRQQLLTEVTPADKFQRAEQWLLDRYDKEKAAPQELVALLQQLQTEPVVKYQDIIGQYPNTQKHLIDQFKKYIGLTPKYYQRILRFNDILSTIQQQQLINWPDVALQCGYADQSHFIKEFRHFSGFNPSEFFQQGRQNEEPNFFPLDR